MKSRHLFFVLLLLLAACGSEARRPRTAVTSPPAVKTTEAVAGIPVSGGDATRGAETAYVTIVVFEDLLSARSAELGAVLDKLREKYTWELLRVVVKHHPSPEHAHAKFAATAGQGVLASKGPDAFFRFRDEISRQKSATPESIRKAALATGMTPADFEAGLEKGAWTEKVEKDVSLAKGLGVNEAPASFVNGIPLTGVPSLDVAKDTIEVELAKARVLERSGIPRKAIYDQAVAANFADPKTRPNAANELEDPRTIWKVPVGSSPVRGKPTALVTLVMFSEFDCVYCKQVTETMTRIRSEYGEKVRFVWKDQPQASHPRSTITANFARAARAQKGDAGFWEVHDKLFVAAKLDDPDLELIAKNASLEVKTAMAAARADAHRKEIDADADLADDVEARGTPHFFVNGRRLVGQQPFEKFKTVLDEEVKKAESIVRGGIATSSLYEWIIKDGRTGEPLHRIVPPNPNAPVRGLATAPVLIQEFGDFQSPPCRRIEPTLEELFKTFPKQIRLAWRDLPLPGSTDAPLAAEAAHDAMVQKGNEAFFKFHGKLFGNQSNLKREDLETYARETGLDLVKFNRALDGHVYRPGLEAEAKVAADASITTAPSFAVGNYILMGPPTYAKLKKLVERVLSEMPSAPYTGPKTGPVASRPAGSGGEKPEPGVVVSGTKFSIVDIVAGTGRAARTGDTVTMHYRGKLLNGAEFDSSHHRSPFSFQLGAGMVIRGWEMGLAGMKTGGKRRITIPPDLAYGNHGSGTSIPANATLVFDVELLSVQ